MNASPLWVFAYGSLIWDPCFPVAERRIGRVTGFHRSFCMASIHFRGTPEAPGLVLALDAQAGASCTGLALRVSPGAEDRALADLRERELISSAYTEAQLSVQCGAETLDALAYVIDPTHAQYLGRMTLSEQATIISRAHGQRGSNRDYLFSTTAHLTDLGIDDPDLEALAAMVRGIPAA